MVFSSKNNQLNISWQSVFRFYFPLLLALLVWYFRNLLLVLATAFILASILEKPIDYLAGKWRSRWLATLLVYLFFLFILSFSLYLIGNLLSQNLTEVINLFPGWLTTSQIQHWLSVWQQLNIGFPQGLTNLNLDQISTFLSNLLIQSWELISKILGGTFYAFLIILISYFINTERKGIEKALRFLTPRTYEEYVIYLWKKSRRKVSDWFFSQIILSLGVGLSIYFIFSLLGVPQAGFLGLLAGIADFIPYLGPLVAAAVSFLVALPQGWLIAGIALISFFLVQAIEALIAPSLRSKTMKLNPLLIILALLVGAKIGGILGVIIILPLSATLVEFLRDLRSGRLVSYLPQRKLL